MTVFSPRSRTKHKTLLSELRRAHLYIVIISITLVGLTLTSTGAIALMAYANDNLRLVAHAIAYNAEAATVFSDHEAALAAITSIAPMEDVASASIIGRNGGLLARWERPARGPLSRLAHLSAIVMQPTLVVAPITHDGTRIGSVKILGDGQNFLRYIIGGFLIMLVSQGLIVITAVMLSRRMMDKIVRPLRHFTRVAHSVRENRDFDERVPGAEIAELNGFAKDFNALLGELALWQTHVKTENASLHHRASHDYLTGLCNRAWFEDRLDRALDEANLKGSRLALLLIDCDRFKEINDQFGHAAGDAVLIGISARLRDQLGAGDLAARLGGDEFALLITSGKQFVDALQIAGRIKVGMQTPMALPEGKSITVSLSIGVAVYPEDANTMSQLMHQADLAMYQSKFMARRQASPSVWKSSHESSIDGN